MDVSRRRFVRTVLLGGAAAASCPRNPSLAGQSPGENVPDAVSSHLASEDFTTCHRVRDGDTIPMAPVSRQVDFAVVGGGPSGLVAGYRLRDRDVVVLEKEPVPGGNARADSWQGMPYAAGAIVTYAESPATALYEEVGLPLQTRVRSKRATLVEGEFIDDLWGSGLEKLFAPSIERSLRQAKRDLFAIDAEAEKGKLDQMRFSDLLRSYPPEVKTWFDELLAWFAAPTEEYSAYVGLYLARSQMGAGLGVLYPEGSSKGGSYTFPGGLSAAALKVAEKIQEAGSDRLVTGATVYRVAQDGSGVNVSYLIRGEPVTIRAKAAIVAAPKFIAKHIVADLPEDQKEAMRAMHYAPFLVGAVAVNGNITSGIATARTIRAPIANFRDASTVSDKQLLRCEMPMRASMRPQLEHDAFVESYAQEVADYFESVFPGSRSKIAEVRIWRRGHNWYIPIPRMMTEYQPRASRPLDRVFFANADSQGTISEFGWALVAADKAVDKAKHRVAADVGQVAVG